MGPVPFDQVIRSSDEIGFRPGSCELIDMSIIRHPLLVFEDNLLPDDILMFEVADPVWIGAYENPTAFIRGQGDRSVIDNGRGI